MRNILFALFALVILSNSAIRAQKVYVFDLKKYVVVDEFEFNIQKDISNYSGTYTCVSFADIFEMDTDYDQLIIECTNERINAFRNYMWMEGEPPIKLRNVSIEGNIFNAQDYNISVNKYEKIYGMFVYLIDKQSNKSLYGLLINHTNYKGEYELYYYRRDSPIGNENQK